MFAPAFENTSKANEFKVLTSMGAQSAFTRRGAISALAGAAIGLMLSVDGAGAGDGYQTADGLAVYLGIIPAAVVKGHPAGHAEAAMHGGAPAGAHVRHVVVAVFDAKSGDRVENATVAATISGLGHVGRKRVSFEPMAIAGTVTYGGFVDFAGADRYQIAVEVSVPGRDKPVRLDFTDEHLR